MIILDYQKKSHEKIIHACIAALKSGKVLAYPTDTSYGLAVDATNINAIKKLYQVKGRDFKKPIHVIPPSVSFAKKIVQWNIQADKLAKKYWPGALTLVVALRAKGVGYRVLSGSSGWLGVRMPKNIIALDLAKHLGNAITTTSANVSGKPDCYSANDILKQFKAVKFTPDIIVNAGELPKRKPSTVVKIENNRLQVLRPGRIKLSSTLTP